MRKYGCQLFALMLMIALLMGCAGGHKFIPTEDGYKPSHVAIGEIIAYTSGVPTIKYDDLIRMTKQNIQAGMYSEDARFLTEKEMENPPVNDDEIVLINLEISFLQGARSSIANTYNLQITYKLFRKTDNKLFAEGSAKTTDEAVSQAATMDLQTAMQYATLSLAKKVKADMQ
ncbi:hypothetical protein K8I28_03575 [bacterium]|nr:hypothetical protein [bacterium]